VRVKLLLLLMVASTFCQADCKYRFGVVRHREPGNGLNLFFFIKAAPQIYHGAHTYTNTSSFEQPVTGDVTSQYNQPMGTVNGTVTETATTTSTVPYSVNYDSLVLTLELPRHDGTYKTVHCFAHDNLCYSYFGQCISNRHPGRHLIEQAVKWIQGGGLSDPNRNEVTQ
jgi:hypothetical protein